MRNSLHPVFGHRRSFDFGNAVAIGGAVRACSRFLMNNVRYPCREDSPSFFGNGCQDLFPEGDCSFSAQAVDVGERGGFLCWDGDVQVVCAQQQGMPAGPYGLESQRMRACSRSSRALIPARLRLSSCQSGSSRSKPGYRTTRLSPSPCILSYQTPISYAISTRSPPFPPLTSLREFRTACISACCVYRFFSERMYLHTQAFSCSFRYIEKLTRFRRKVHV